MHWARIAPPRLLGHSVHRRSAGQEPDYPMSSMNPMSTASEARTARPASRSSGSPVDLSDPESFVAGVPHDRFRWLREHDPVHWQPECKMPGLPRGPGYWALTRHEDVSYVSKNAQLFSSERGTAVLSDLAPKDLHNMRQQLINMDPPTHTQLRKLMNPNFKPGTVRQTEEATRSMVGQTLDAVERGADCDFVEAVSAPITLGALTRLLGVPGKDSRKFYKWTNKLIGAADPGVSSELRAKLAVLEIFVYAAFLARKRRKRPTPDIFSALVNGDLGGAPLDRLQLGMNFFLLVVAGNETTRNALSGGVLALCEHPDQLERLRDDPSLIPRAIEEMLRWVTPVMQFRRTATCDAQIGDQRIREGEKVVMYYGAANRDPRVFDGPERFDITRDPNPHLAFGTGTHFCAGSHMARLGMRITLEELLKRFPAMRLAGPPQRLRSNFINGIKSLPIRLA
jgi:cholest-4-en-3-one 26-monooxygenase